MIKNEGKALLNPIPYENDQNRGPAPYENDQNRGPRGVSMKMIKNEGRAPL